MYTPTHDTVNPAITDAGLNDYALGLLDIESPSAYDLSDMISVYVELNKRGLL